MSTEWSTPPPQKLPKTKTKEESYTQIPKAQVIYIYPYHRPMIQIPTRITIEVQKLNKLAKFLKIEKLETWWVCFK